MNCTENQLIYHLEIGDEEIDDTISASIKSEENLIRITNMGNNDEDSIATLNQVGIHNLNTPEILELGSSENGDGKAQEELQFEAGLPEEPKEQQVIQVLGDTEVTTPQPSTPLKSSTQSKSKKSVIHEIAQMREERKKYYTKKFEIDRQKLSAYKERTQELAQRNTLLKELINIMSKK